MLRFGQRFAPPSSEGRQRFLMLSLAATLPLVWLLYAVDYHTHPFSTEGRIRQSAFPCRGGPDGLVVLQVERDGRILGPDGGYWTVEQAALMIPTWLDQRGEGTTIALYAPADCAYARLLPLLDAAKQPGILKVVLAQQPTPAERK